MAETDVGARPRLAMLVTSYGPNSHGNCFGSRYAAGLTFLSSVEEPRCRPGTMHLMELADDDIGITEAAKLGMSVYPSVALALCDGGDELAVDGVLIIGEHGDYPYNSRGQRLYPRRELFDQVTGVFRQAGRAVPVFNDKHLSWNWPWAQHMWREAGALGIPFMAGSSLPLSPFVPAVPLPDGDPLDHVIAFGFGDIDHYGFHALETAQFVCERRAGGETGVAEVECLTGAAVWDAYRAGRWPVDLCEAAWDAVHEPYSGRPPDHTLVPDKEGMAIGTFAFDITYRDGHRATVFMLSGFCQEFGFAYRVTGQREIIATSVVLDIGPRLSHFSALVRSIEDMVVSGAASIPAERTYLTTGILAHICQSYAEGRPVATPGLDIAYQPMPVPAHWTEVLRPRP